MEPEKDKTALLIGIFQNTTLWMGIMAYAALELVKTNWGKENLGNWQDLVTHCIATILLLLAILSGKETFEFIRAKVSKKVKEHEPEPGE